MRKVAHVPQIKYVSPDEVEYRKPSQINAAGAALSIPGQYPRTVADMYDFSVAQHDLEAPGTRRSGFSSAGPKPKISDVPEQKLRATREAGKPIEAWYQANKKYSYPDREAISKLMDQTGVTEDKLKLKLNNKRKRDPSLQGSVKSSASHALSGRDQEPLVFNAPSPQMDQYLQTGRKGEGIPLATLNSLVHDNNGPPFTKKKSGSGPSLDFTGDMNSQPPSVGTEGGDGTGSAQTPSVSKRFRKKGKRLIKRPIPPERDGDKMYQCIFCNCGFRKPGGRSRHQEGCDPSREQHVCKVDELLRQDGMGNPRCPFCGIADSSDKHLNEDHNYRACLEKPIEERAFRPDNLKRHFRDHHKAKLSIPPAWVERKAVSQARCWCGFCEKDIGTRLVCDEHINDHFRNGKDMASWVPDKRALKFAPIENFQPLDRHEGDQEFWFLTVPSPISEGE